MMNVIRSNFQNYEIEEYFVIIETQDSIFPPHL